MRDNLSILKDKKIALCVSGSISAYKSIHLASQWTQAGACVQVLMTESSKQFIGKASFEGITHNKVVDSFWENTLDSNIDHLDVAKNSDVIVVAPATANIISKIARGICDDVISTTVIATTKPVLIAPAMDGNMYDHFAIRENISKLKKNGVIILEPENGYLASGVFGKGRLADLEKISEKLTSLLTKKYDLNNKKILVSAGGTREPLDAVRFIGNRSSGKMGHEIAEAGLQRGANITLVSSSRITASSGIKKIDIETAQEMNQEITNRIDNQDSIIMAAAVSDFAPKNIENKKIKKELLINLNIELEKTPDILSNIKNKKCLKVGFAAETDNHIENGMNKLKSKGLDLIVINDVSDHRIGFDSDYNKVNILNKDGIVENTEIETKRVIADKILNHVSELL